VIVRNDITELDQLEQGEGELLHIEGDATCVSF
jgi:hypothetical protein